MKNLPTTLLQFLLLIGFLFFNSVGKAQTIYGLSGDRLISFEANSPIVLFQSIQFTGLVSGQNIVGMDFRPTTGQLYGLGYNPTLGSADLYVIDRMTAVAAKVGNTSLMFNPNVSDFGFDFNPTVDRIRVTTSDNFNYRLHPTTGALAATDGNLAFAPADINATVDPTVGSSAYTNSYIGATSTTLYDFDVALNALLTQIPPNNGTLNTVGGSGLNLNIADPSVDIDITYDASSATNIALLVANTGASVNDNLYKIDLTTGLATEIGAIGAGIALQDIAILIDRTLPTVVSGHLIYALNSGNNLLSFDSDAPNLIRTWVPITGVAVGQVLSGLDFRPATAALYAIGYNPTTGEARLYTLNTTTGAATPIGSAPVMLAVGLGKVGMDFNPTVDRIRITGSNNTNYRLHPETGAIVATDMNLSFSGMNAGTNPSIGAVAYTNSFNGAGTTTLYNYDDSLNVLTTQIPPNNGTLNVIGSSGITVNLTDPSADLDIFYDLNTGQNTAYLVANIGTQTADNLYTINLNTGMATLVGKIGFGIAITDVAVLLTLPVIETACDEVSNGCARFELIAVKKDASGDEIYRVRVTNTCAAALNYVAFALPKGIEAISPASGSTYVAPSTRLYTVRSPNFSPYYSIRFKTAGTGIANGQSDIFEYKLPKQADVVYLKAFARLADGIGIEGLLDTYNCPSLPFNGSRNEDNDIRFEHNTSLVVYPNPSSGQLFVDISGSTGHETRLSVISVTGQYVHQLSLSADTTVASLELPQSLSNGLYFLELLAADGSRQVKRFLLQR